MLWVPGTSSRYYLEEVWIRHFVRKLPQNVIQKAGQLMLYVKNTLIFLNSGKERLTKSDISAIEEIVCDGQSVTTLCETHLFPNFQEAARELVPKIRRYSSLYLVELDGTCDLNRQKFLQQSGCMPHQILNLS